MNRRNFIKKGALFVPTIFIPRLIRAYPANCNPAFFKAKPAPSGGGGGGGPLLNWRVNSDLTDASGNSHDASMLAGSAAYGADKNSNANHAFSFGGSNAFGLSDASVANFTSSNFSCGFWLYLNSGNVATAPVVLSKGIFNNTGYFIQIGASGVPGNGDLSAAFGQSGARQFVTGAYPITEGNWYHIVFVRSGATGFIYKNGADTGASSDTLIDPASESSGLRIGGYSGGGSFTNGLIDDVKIWSRALSSTEVATEFSNGPA